MNMQILQNLWHMLQQFIADEPLAYPYLIALAAGALGLIATCFYTARAKSLLKLLQGAVPKLSETEQLREFEKRRAYLADKQGSAGFLAAICLIVCILVLLFLFKLDDSNPLLLVAGGLEVIASALLFLFFGNPASMKCLDLEASRPELVCLRYLRDIHVPRDSQEDKLFWANLDDYVYAFDVRQTMGANQPLDSNLATALGEAHLQATEERPETGALALILWRDSTGHRVKTVVTKIKSVEEAPTTTSTAAPGRYITSSAGRKFCGGKIAYFCDKPDEKIERGWLTTADRAHVLLASLRWLNDHQREYCYQLINPGKPYPAIADWAAVK